MRVGVKEAFGEDLAVEGLQELPGGFAALGPFGRGGHGAALHFLHHQQARGRVRVEDVGDRETAVGRQDVLHAPHVRGLLAEVELAAQRLREVVDDRRQVEDALEGGAPAGLLDEHFQQAQVIHDVLLGSRPLHLHHHALAGLQGGAMDLSDGAGRQGLRLNGGEDVFPGDAQFAFHGGDDLLLGQRRDALLKRLQLFEEGRRHQVRACRENLAELCEGGAGGVEGLSEAASALADGFFIVDRARQHFTHAGADHDPAQAPGAAQKPALAGDAALLDHRHGGAVGGVHDDDGATGVVGDAVRHVAEKELLAAAHAKVADDDGVGALLFDRAKDAGRRVIVDDYAGMAAAAGELAREAHQARRRVLHKLFVDPGLGPVGGQRRDHDLHDDEVGALALGHGRGPMNGGVRGGRAVGGDDDAVHGLRQ